MPPYCAGYQLSDDGKCMSMKRRQPDGSYGECDGEGCDLFCPYIWQLRAFEE